MKTNIIKGGKSALSILLAIAMLAVSIFTVNIGISASAAQPTDEWDGAYTQPTQTDKNGNILVTTAEELAWVALKSGDAGKGKSYKVADGVKVFYINANTSNLTLAQVTNKLNGNNTREWVYQNQIFQGSFDGNGVTVYGLYSTASDQYNHNGGLFPYIKGNVTIKNVKIANSYIGSYGVGGAVAGQLVGDANVSKIAFSNIAVTNNYIFTAANTGYVDSATGIFGGGVAPASVSFENCAVYGNTHYSKSGEQCAAFIGQFNSQNYTVKNSIALGVTPIGAQKGYWTRLASCYKNVYTDQDMSTACWGDTSFANGTVNQVSATTGYAAKAAMPNLDWNNIWWANVGCPELRIFHSLKLADNGDGTHALKCEDCGRKGLSEAHKYTVDSKLKRSVCACGSVKELTSYEWKGRVATGFAGGSGTKSDPYIIETPDQLAYLALSTTLNSAGKYYKVADNRIFNMGGMQGVDKTSGASTVKNATKNTDRNWTADGAKFSGNFDGNGVIIYNLYSKGGYCGLFPNMSTNNTDKSCTIKNVTVLSSYISGYHFSGGIVGLANASTTSQKLIFENCAVENCYISDNGNTNSACNRTSGTIVGSVVHNGTTISNCLAKNNITAATDISGGFIGTTSNYAAAMSIKDSVSIGTLPYSTLTAGSTKTIGTKANQPGDYVNVYTDKAVDASFTGVKTLTTAQMTGANALNSMKLDFDGTWFANTSTPELQVSHHFITVYNTQATHAEVCEDGCDVTGIKELHTFVKDTSSDTRTCSVCGYSVPYIINDVDTWKWQECFDDSPYWGYADPNMEGDGSEADPYIISTSEQLAAVALFGGDKTAGKYYKVDDNVDVLYLTPNADSYDSSSLDKLKESLTVGNGTTNSQGWPKDKNGSVIKPWTTSYNYAFQGHFDGNGVTIRGMASYGQAHGGLFPYIKGNVSVKNITIEDSYISGTINVGAISGGIYYYGDADQLTDIKIENCSVKNNYIELKERSSYSKGWGSVGGAIGWAGRVTSSATVNNCYVADNKVVNPGTRETRAFFGDLTQNGVSNGNGGYNWPTKISVKNSVTDLCPYNTDQYANQAAYFSNVYTTTNKTANDKTVGTFTDSNVKVVSQANITGAAAKTNMPALDWENIWYANPGTPELRVCHNLSLVSAGANTHYHKCSVNGCSLTGFETAHTFAWSDDTHKVCSGCGYSKECIINSVDTWRWTSDLPSENPYFCYGDPNMDGDGSESNPYIISTSEQLAAVALWGGDKTAGKYYKVDDKVKVLHLTPNTNSADNTSLDNLKTSLSAEKDKNNTTIKKWATNSSYAFQGHFDGNGVTIRGMAAVSTTGGAGLFPFVKGNVSFKNVTVTDSYISGTAGVAGIVGFVSDWGDISNISFENCAVVGNYIENTNSKNTDNWSELGGLAGSVMCPTSSAKVNNCIVFNNKYSMANGGTPYAFFGSIAQNANAVYSFANSITDIAPWTSASTYFVDKLANYSNIYTTVGVVASEFDGTPTAANVKQVAVADMKGTAAKANMPGLDWLNVWLANSGTPELRVFHNLDYNRLNEAAHIPYCTDSGCNIEGVAEPHIVEGTSTKTCSLCGYSETACNDNYYTNLVKRGLNDSELYKWNEPNKPLPEYHNHVGGYGISTKYNPGEFEEWTTLHGSGTKDDPYVISDVLTLYRIIASGGTDLGVPQYFELDRDIDIGTNQKYQWLKLASAFTGTNEVYSYKPFAGILDGNGHTITGLYSSTDEEAAGFIPKLAAGGEIRNLHIRSAGSNKSIVRTSNGSAGILVGVAESGSVITGCSVEGCAVAGTKGSGMLVGSGSPTIKNSYYIGTVGSKYYNASGNAVGASAIAVDYTGTNGATAVWYKGGADNNTPKLVNRANAMQYADVDGDGDGTAYFNADLTALNERLNNNAKYKNVYGDANHDGVIDVRDLYALETALTGVSTAGEYDDGFWYNAKKGNFEIFYSDTDNYDSARMMQLFLSQTVGFNADKHIGSGDNAYDILIKTDKSLGEGSYKVTYDSANVVLKVIGGSSTAVYEAVTKFVNGSSIAGSVVYTTTSGTIESYKNSIKLDSSISSDKYYYVWGDEFNKSEAANVNGEYTVNYGKWNIRNKSTDDGNHASGFIDIRESERDETPGLNEITNNNELSLKCGYDSNGKIVASGVGTQNSMLFKHGYMEIVASIPDNGFAFPAWWLMSNAGFNNRAITKSLYSKVYELNPDYNDSIYFDPTDYKTYKYKLPTHTTETDIWEVIQQPTINTSTKKLQPSERRTLFVGLHKWYPYSGSRSGELTLYELDWNNVKANGEFEKVYTASGVSAGTNKLGLTSAGQNSCFSTLAEFKKDKYGRTYDNNYKKSIANEAAAGITELKYVYGNSGVQSDNHLPKRRYGFLWTDKKIVFMAYDGVASNAKLLYQRTVDLADMNYDGIAYQDQYAYLLLENHLFTSSSNGSVNRSLNNYDGNGNAYSAFANGSLTDDSAAFTIDYVRLYQLSGERDLVTAETEAFNSSNRWQAIS